MITLDAGVLIALAESQDPYHHTACEFSRDAAGEDLVIHPINLAEVLVGGARASRTREMLADLEALGLRVASRDDEEPVRLANLRAHSGLKLPDGCALDTALSTRSTLATLDDRLARVARGHGLTVAPAAVGEQEPAPPARDHRERAREPEDVDRLFRQRLTAGDAEGLAQLYESGAVRAAPGGVVTSGRGAIGRLYGRMLADAPTFAEGEHAPVVRADDLALTSTRLGDGGRTVEVLRRQSDGTWLMAIDQPDLLGGG